MDEVAVVHLVRRKNGIAPFEEFLASYLAHKPGMPHDLLLLFKGFGHGSGTDEFDALLKNVPHRRLFVGDHGFDLSPYFVAVKEFEYRYFCFFNSFSQILAADWLSSLYRAVTSEGVGLVGATGSYQSYSTNSLERSRLLGKEQPAARLRKRIAHVLHESDLRLAVLRTGAWLLGSVGLWDPGRYFPEFPNHHIRTNAFMASRTTLARIRTWPMIFKLSTQMFESGRDSLTNQVLRLGMRPLVVTRAGDCFEKEDWHLSNTFRQGAQENLLVADNQTRDYENANLERRVELARQTWGTFATRLDGGHGA